MKNREKILKWAPVIWFVAVALVYIFLYVTKITYLLDADMSSEMVLADVLTKEHGIMSRNWFYSTELRFLNNQLIFGFFLLFGHNYHIARVLSGITLMAIMLSGYYYLIKQMGLKRYFFATAPILMMPFSFIYSDIILVGLYYIPHITISFFSMGLVFAMENSDTFPKKRNLGIILFILSLLAGIGGPRQIIIFYLPLLLTAFILLYVTKQFKYHSIYLAFAGSAIGYVLNSKVISKFYKYNDWSGFTYNTFDGVKLDKIFQGFLNVLGFTEGEIFSFATVRTGVAFILFFLIIVYYIYFFKKVFVANAIDNSESTKDNSSNLKTSTNLRPSKSSEDSKSFVYTWSSLTEMEILTGIFFLSATVIYVMIYLFTDMFYEDRYTLPFIVFLLPIMCFSLSNHGWIKPVKIAFISALSIMIFAASLCVYKAYWFTDKTAEHREIVNFLLENDYNNGYSTYWNANLITELSNGKIDSYVWTSSIENIADVDDLYRWLQVKSHKDNPPTDKVFIVLSKEEYDNSILRRYIGANQLIYLTSNYYVLGFNNYESLITILSNYTFNLNEAGYVGTATPVNGTWQVNNGQHTVGPFIIIYKGNYVITVNGQNLSASDIEFSYGLADEDATNTLDPNSVALYGDSDNLETSFETNSEESDSDNALGKENSENSENANKPVVICIEKTDNSLIYKLKANENLHDFQISISNNTDSTVILNQMTILRESTN